MNVLISSYKIVMPASADQTPSCHKFTYLIKLSILLKEKYKNKIPLSFFNLFTEVFFLDIKHLQTHTDSVNQTDNSASM